MPQTVAQVMTRDPLIIDAAVPVTTAAEQMRDNDIGAVIVHDRGELIGVLTDRDIAIRVVAAQRELSTPVGRVCSSSEVRSVTPDTLVEDAIELMRSAAVRRLPVVEGNRTVGIVSLGDLAMERDEGSALADISAAKPTP